jgi:hypothetical protein
MRVPVSLQERLQPQHLGGIRLADQHRPLLRPPDEPDATKDQRAHDSLTQVGLGDDQCAQLRGRDEERLGVLFGVAVHERVAPGELRDLADKLAGALARDRCDVPHAVPLADDQAALGHDEHAGSGLAGGEQPLAARVASQGTEAVDPRDVHVGQTRKHLMAAAGQWAQYFVSGDGRHGGMRS